MASMNAPRSLTYSVCPPMALPLPGMMFAVVTPPASAILMPGSFGIDGVDGAQPWLDGPGHLVAVGAGAGRGPAEDADVRVRVDQAGDDDLAGDIVDLGFRRQPDLVLRADLDDLALEDDEHAALDNRPIRGMDARPAIHNRHVLAVPRGQPALFGFGVGRGEQHEEIEQQDEQRQQRGDQQHAARREAGHGGLLRAAIAKGIL